MVSDSGNADRYHGYVRDGVFLIAYETAGCQTVSIGVTQAKDENADALYNRVDKALYMAKAAEKIRL